MIQRIAIMQPFPASPARSVTCGSVPPVAAPHVGNEPALPPRKDPLIYVGDLGKSRSRCSHIPARKAEVYADGGFGSRQRSLHADFNGDVYVSDGHDGKLVEYYHGGTKPVRTLSDPGYYTQGCASDLRT